MAKIDDIVRASGVSRSTVFRFLSGNNVRFEAKKAIMQAMEELNYKTDVIYKQQKIVIEISVSQSFESFKGFTEVVEGITQRSEEKGINVQIVIRKPDQMEADYSHWNDNVSLRGVIVIGKNIHDEEIESEILVSKKIPHIFVNRIFDNPNVSYVAMDLKKAASDIVEYLISKGHRDIAVMGYPKKLRVDNDKLNGYLDAYRKNGLKVSDKWYKELNENENWEDFAKAILNDSNHPTAFFGICDSYAMKFINMAQSLGYKVPQDIAVVGMDDLDIAEYFKPALTTIHAPFKKMGMVAVDSLLQLLTNDDIGSVKTIIKHELVFRESC